MKKISERLTTNLINVKSTIQRMEEDKKKKEMFEERVAECKLLLYDMKKSLEEYKKARYTANKLQAAKKKRDQEAIDRSMELATVLIAKGNDEVPFFRTTDGALPETTLMIRVGEDELPLEMIEGTGFNEGTSLTTLISVVSSTEYMKFLFLDEYFASVSPLNSENLSKKLNDLFDDKFQVVMVEQKDEVFEYTAHREFFIEYDKVTQESRVVTYDVDKEGNRRKVEDNE